MVKERRRPSMTTAMVASTGSDPGRLVEPPAAAPFNAAAAPAPLTAPAAPAPLAAAAPPAVPALPAAAALTKRSMRTGAFGLSAFRAWHTPSSIAGGPH